jgi:hypothetical protein
MSKEQKHPIKHQKNIRSVSSDCVKKRKSPPFFALAMEGS